MEKQILNIELEHVNLKEGLYIPSIECCWLYKENKEHGNYEVKEEFLKKLLKGKIDWCYELAMSDLSEDIEIKKMADGKLYTLDIINVKYNNKYKTGGVELNSKELRDWSYNDSLSIKFNKNEIMNWKRSGGKARVGENLFIKKEICKKTLDWARMDLKYEGDVDIASMRAYESLPLSSIMAELIEINPKNILVIDDFESKFQWKMSETWLENGELKTETREVEECNSIWDGEGLLSKKIFDKYDFLKDKGVALLRNRYTKCAGFNCDLEKFYKKYCEEHDKDYETFEVLDIYDNPIKVKDIELITTPSSLKIKKSNQQVLEFKDENGNTPYAEYEEKAWLYYWKDKADNKFGVAKVDKPSYFENGKYQRTSYQMINTIPFTNLEIKELVAGEVEYINRLKNDLEFFMQEIKNPLEDNYLSCLDAENEDLEVGKDIDVNSAFCELVKINKDFVKTQVFKDYRRNFINSYISTVREGKVKIEGDYCIAFGNPIEMIYSTVREFKGESLSLVNNELYCARFKDGDEVIGFRNPHTNTGCVGVQVNKKIDELETYFKCTPNIMFVNAIKYPVLSMYSGMDYDIDSVLLTKNKTILNDCKRIRKKSNNDDEFITPISVNRIKNTDDNKAVMNGSNMAKIDHTISQNYIGGVVNLSQEINSFMNHLLNNKCDNKKYIKELYARTSTLTSISAVEIDKAKKQFEGLDVPKELSKMKMDLKMVDDEEVRALHKDIEELKQQEKELSDEILEERKELREPILKERRKQRQPILEERRKLKKQILEENEKITNDDVKINELQNEISIIDIHRQNEIDIINTYKQEEIAIINTHRQNEIIDIKKEIGEKRKEISKLDTRRLKPRFFKYVGDNESKKSRAKVNKNYKKKLYKETMGKYAIDIGVSIEDINVKDEELVKLLKQTDEVFKEWKDKVYVQMDTPMDFLELEIDSIKNSNRKGTKQVIELVKQSKHKSNNEVVEKVCGLIKEADKTINTYRADKEINYKERQKKVKSCKDEVVEEIKCIKIIKADMSSILKECLNGIGKKNNKKNIIKSGIESLTLELLFRIFGTKLLDMFVKGGDFKS